MLKMMIPVASSVLLMAALCMTPPAYGAGDSGVSPAEIQRYQRQRELELKREQDLRADLSSPQSREETRRQRRRFEFERLHQRQLMERQRSRVGAERVRLRPASRAGSIRGITLQRLRREQASERLSRKLLR